MVGPKGFVRVLSGYVWGCSLYGTIINLLIVISYHSMVIMIMFVCGVCIFFSILSLYSFEVLVYIRVTLIWKVHIFGS